MADAADKLETYRAKRDFGRTAEPSGMAAPAEGDEPRFVVQKHAARNLHYDFRLEIDGVLVSWAVPKGPSTDPKVRRLAVRTEDHPLGYADFEGVIAEGEYGAGTVLVWDAGPYRNLKAEAGPKDEPPMTMAEALEAGAIAVELEGTKLRGGFALRQTKMGGQAKNWLLFKMKDEAAEPGREVTEEAPASVLTGRTLEEVAADAAGA